MQRTRITRGTTSIYRETQPHPILTDRKRNIGRTRLRLLDGSAEPLRKEFGAVLLLPCTRRQLSGRRMRRVLVFIIAFVLITLPLFQNKVNDFFIKSAIFQNKI